MSGMGRKLLRGGAGAAGALGVGALALRGVLEWLYLKGLAEDWDPEGRERTVTVRVEKTGTGPEWLLIIGGGLLAASGCLYLAQRGQRKGK